MEQQARRGDTVHVHYTGTLADGSVFDSSEGREPLTFEIGSGQVIPGFDAALDGMTVGEQKTVTIPADDAYGPRRDELMLGVPREQFPAHITPEVGQQLQMSQEGESFMVTIREVADDVVVLDANHPLAGEDLTFALSLVRIG